MVLSDFSNTTYLVYRVFHKTPLSRSYLSSKLRNSLGNSSKPLQNRGRACWILISIRDRHRRKISLLNSFLEHDECYVVFGRRLRGRGRVGKKATSFLQSLQDDLEISNFITKSHCEVPLHRPSIYVWQCSNRFMIIK